MKTLRASTAWLAKHLAWTGSTQTDVEILGHTDIAQNTVNVKHSAGHHVIDAAAKTLRINDAAAFTLKLRLENHKVINVNSDFVCNATDDLAVYLVKEGWELFTQPAGYAQPIPTAC